MTEPSPRRGSIYAHQEVGQQVAFLCATTHPLWLHHARLSPDADHDLCHPRSLADLLAAVHCVHDWHPVAQTSFQADTLGHPLAACTAPGNFEAGYRREALPLDQECLDLHRTRTSFRPSHRPKK